VEVPCTKETERPQPANPEQKESTNEDTYDYCVSEADLRLEHAAMAKLVKIAETKDLTPGQAAAFDVEGQKIALFNIEGTFYAIGDTCTHRGGPLSEGSVAGTTVTCPWHRADFDLKTGAVMRPPAPQGVPSYRVVIEGGDVKIEI